MRACACGTKEAIGGTGDREMTMRKIWAAAGLAAALLAGCDEGGAALTDDGAAFCPGGANCPTDGDGGLTLDGTDVVALAETVALASLAGPAQAPAPGTTAAAATEASAPSGQAATPDCTVPGTPGCPVDCRVPGTAGCPVEGKALICPSNECPKGVSGILWLTPPGETACRPSQGQPCKPGMKTNTYGWLCRRGGDCGALPRKP